MLVEYRGMSRRILMATVAGAVLGALAFTVPAAVDGDTRTRWESRPKADPQWIYVDLGASCQVTRVRLRWAAARDKAYRVRTMPGEPSPPTPPRNLRVVDVTSTRTQRSE
jgi:NedA-like, galactose-binding domain